MSPPLASAADPLWYKDAIFYEVHVRAFQDSTSDGMGDFDGLTQRLDYLQDLGVTALWLLPFYPSPWRDDGYDISDYLAIHPSYGTMSDFRRFLREAHERGLRVITELVINHTSDQHPWFQRARKAPPGSRQREYYVWDKHSTRYRDARIIFRDYETSNWTWDHVADAYYWHRFYAHQPDLNFDNPVVRRAIVRVLDAWFEMGVDGMRLDAVPYLFEREGTSCENLPETHAFLKDLRRHLDERHPNRMLLAEANQWPEDAVAYFGQGDECHMAFHFPIMPRMFMALHMEDRFPILDILSQTPAIPERSQWALFLRNHDELTLEMVTDEERDYMYRVYGRDPRSRINLGIRRRLAPLLGNHRRKIELMNGLLFSLPGSPVLYYGDEIGMGDNIYLGDRNGVRTPMQWSADKNAGFSRANPQRLYLPITIDPEYHYEAVNVETQLANPHSLLWWMRRLIATRKRYRAFGRGTIEFLHPDNRKVLAFVRKYEEERILVVANLSRFVQYVELDLSAFQGLVPVEIFGRTEFPRVGTAPYLLTLGPHTFYWFSLDMPRTSTVTTIRERLRHFDVEGSWEEVLDPAHRPGLTEALIAHLKRQPWFAARPGRFKELHVLDAPAVPLGDGRARFLLVQAEYVDAPAEGLSMPLVFAPGPPTEADPRPAIATVRNRDGTEGRVCEAAADPRLVAELIDAIGRRREYEGECGALKGRPGARYRELRGNATAAAPTCSCTERGNVVACLGDRLVLKLLRHAQEGPHPDAELGKFLTDQVEFAHVPPFAGTLDYVREGGEPATLGVLFGFVPNQGTAWTYTLDAVESYLEETSSRAAAPPLARPAHPLVEAGEVPPLARELLGPYLESARLLGRRTAEFHAALAQGGDDPAFAPEPYTPFYQRSVYQSLRNETTRVLQALKRGREGLPESWRGMGDRILSLEPKILRSFQEVTKRRIEAMRIRCHGDLHLGQVLCTGKEFHLIDLEGDPTRPLSERRIKRSPLRDVAGMIRSFQVASLRALETEIAGGSVPSERRAVAAMWVRFWQQSVCRTFLSAYLDAVASAGIVPRSREDIRVLLNVFLLETAVARLGLAMSSDRAAVGAAMEVLLSYLEEGA